MNRAMLVPLLQRLTPLTCSSLVTQINCMDDSHLISASSTSVLQRQTIAPERFADSSLVRQSVHRPTSALHGSLGGGTGAVNW